MLTFETPYYEVEGVIVFRDHADTGLFHYLAGPPRLTRDEDGTPHLVLMKYRHVLEHMGGAEGALLREQAGGAFLMFGVDCGLSNETKQAVVRALESIRPPGAGPVALAPVLYTKGKVSVLALDAQSGGGAATPPPEGEPPAATPSAAPSRFIRQVLGTATPSLLQDQRAIFSLALSVDAATLLEDAYRQDLSPIGVMYELEFAGLRPALSIRVKADLARCQEELSAGLGLRAGSNDAKFGAEVKLAIEKLVQSGAVVIEVIKLQEGQGVEELHKAAMDMVKETILKEFFSPAMATNPAAAAQQALADATRAQQGAIASSTNQNRTNAGAQGSKFELALQFQYKKREELKTVTYDYDAASPEKRTHAPNGFFSALVGGTEKDKHIRVVNLDDPFFKLLRVEATTTGGFEDIDLKKVLVHVQYGGTLEAPDDRDDLPFAPDDLVAKHFEAFRDGRGLAYRYQTKYLFGQSEAIAAQRFEYETPWRDTTSRALVVHPPEDVPMLRVYIEPGVVEWELVQQIDALLSYDDEANAFHTERTFQVKRDSARQVWTVRPTNPEVTGYTVRYTWHLANGRQIEGTPEPMSVSHLFVGDPFAERLHIIVQPQVDATNVVKIDVELAYDDPTNDFRVHKVRELAPPYTSTRETIPLIDSELVEYTYTTTLYFANGSHERRAPVKTEKLSVIINERGIYHDVQVRLVGSMADAGLLAVQVDLRGEPPEGHPVEVQSFIFDPAEFPPPKPMTTTLRLLLRADGPRAFEYRTTAIKNTGEEIVRDWEVKEGESLLLPIPRLVTP